MKPAKILSGVKACTERCQQKTIMRGIVRTKGKNNLENGWGVLCVTYAKDWKTVWIIYAYIVH